MHVNDIELIGMYGDDTIIACSAWTSTSRALTPEKQARVPALLKMLKEGSDDNPHTSPYEKSALHFLVTSEIASHIHMLKHRIGVSINAESARYKELKDDKFYIPVDWPNNERDALEVWCRESFERYHSCLKRLIAGGMDKKRAKESARFYLPYANQIQCDIMFNFSSFIHFVKLRHAPSAQLEIRQIAGRMLDIVREDGRFMYSLEAWGL